MKLYRVSLRDPSLSRKMVASVHANSADEALNLVRDTYPWCEEFEVIE